MKKYHGKEILEVGNVLAHYFHLDYDILDKYEKTEGVINKDVIDFQPSEKYDLDGKVRVMMKSLVIKDSKDGGKNE